MSAPRSERALILAPQGRDAQVAAAMLGEAGIAGEICNAMFQLVDQIIVGAGFALITEEALHRADLHSLVSWLKLQPDWSDFPLILLTSRGGGLERNAGATRLLKALGNVSFLERPFHPTTLISMCSAALRSRRRQYEAQSRLLELDVQRQRLMAANETLESRVDQRTVELERAYQKVVKESAQREMAEDQLRQVQKLEMIGELTGGVAHDFNNLLTAVLGNLSLLKKQLPATDAKAQRLIDGAVEGANRGATLTQRLLAFARRQRLEVVPSDIVALVWGMKELLERSIGPQITLSFDLTTDSAVAMIDVNQIELALLNLAVNARDAMPNGGELCVGVDHKGRPDDRLKDGAFIRIWVKDTGLGMDEATLNRAIDPFFSTKEIGKGTGLGLSMVHGLAVQLGGVLRLESAVGKGTFAELYFPATQHVTEARSEAMTPAPAATRRSRILLVDDDALVAMSGCDMLEDLGHEVLEAHSGKQALEILQKPAGIDLLITDFAMPGMTGAQLIEAARAMFPSLPILLATGYAELPSGNLNEIPRIGKPYTQPQLAREIAKVLSAA